MHRRGAEHHLRDIALRAWVYRALLAAALLTVALTTAVLAALTAYSGAIGDAAVRRSLAEQGTAAEAALVVKADVPGGERQAAEDAVRAGGGRHIRRAARAGAGTPCPGSGVTITEPTGPAKPSGITQSGMAAGSIQRAGTGG
ncbi:hypothetical protein AB0O67_03370 [Streptomyces sp. NPDC086077]|uniref:hypothetical protein n=1 Tax=Streptomyces sp. NPDC086077 TaxID=3154862 RepID=UPI00343773F6